MGCEQALNALWELLFYNTVFEARRQTTACSLNHCLSQRLWDEDGGNSLPRFGHGIYLNRKKPLCRLAILVGNEHNLPSAFVAFLR